MLNYDPVANLRHYPIPMGRFGQNPHGQNLYRIVFTQSRRHLVYGEWPDGSRQAQYVRKYFQVTAPWIMEQWLPAEDYAKCSKEYWARELSILGPYPDQGEYEICHEFNSCLPTDASLDLLIMAIREQKNRSIKEKLLWHREDAIKEKNAIGSQQDAMIRNWLPAFGTAAMSGYGGGSSHKTAPILKSAEELGLPTSGGQFRTKNKERQKFEVPLEI